MTERSELIESIRGDLVGPSRPVSEPVIATFTGTRFADSTTFRRGPLAWRPVESEIVQEVLYYDRETPHRKYGAGLLHPGALNIQADSGSDDDPQAIRAASERDPGHDNAEDETIAEEDIAESGETSGGDEATDDFEVTSPDVRHPSTVGVSFCVRLDEGGCVLVRLPQEIQFNWQDAAAAAAFPVNGRYEACTREWTEEDGQPRNAPMWRRRHGVRPDTLVSIDESNLESGTVYREDLNMPDGSPIALRLEVFPRRLRSDDNTWLLTVVLRNSTQLAGGREPREAVLFQTFFDVSVKGGKLKEYPESERPLNQLEEEEQSLALLYRESATWGIGHGCACGWDAEPGGSPQTVYADIMPTVELPSMTPDIFDSEGNAIQLSMRALGQLSDDGSGSAWQSLENLSEEYGIWLQQRREEATTLPGVADRNLDSCEACLNRINDGISLLRQNARARKAFKLANISMLLQQISTKQVLLRPLGWDGGRQMVFPAGERLSPWEIYQSESESGHIGSWRAFQIAFLLMSLKGVVDGSSPDRDIVDLIWFPTGGGKTEAYLGVMAFYMFHERLLIEGDAQDAPQRDGTNVLMRYTLRMLTTQQFQRAASLICAMEFLRRNPAEHGMGTIPGRRFSLGLWIGGSGSPNKLRVAKTEVNVFKSGKTNGNPLILTECPWCRSQIGRYDGSRPRAVPMNRWNSERTRGITEVANQGHLLHCPDGRCEFGVEDWQQWLPVEVIDERIYANPPSLVIGTADKLAMIAYRPAAGALFGRGIRGGELTRIAQPPGLIVQDELHLISGPLGTMYALYEGIFERLCSSQHGDEMIKPKIVASTATIRGAAEQVMALYARENVQLFPSPALLMGDSFFGKYARNDDGSLKSGRLYLGIHANDYGSVLTAQVRAFSSALFRPYSMSPERRDPWWTLLAFYNSIRELGGAKTLFDSDIRSRLKFLFNREDFPFDDRRLLPRVEELTSRLSQAEIVGMMDKLATAYSDVDNKAFDACLVSSIIEVGVDIDRLSLMGVVGQPKTTAQYIQVTGRVGRKWWERPGLILTLYNPSKSRDRSHFEQFSSYHRRLYERVEPTTATPFALSAIQRALPGALIAWARQHGSASVQDNSPVESHAACEGALEEAYRILEERCGKVQVPEDQERSLRELERVRSELERKWRQNPQEWERFPPSVDGEYLMLWPGQFATLLQKDRGVTVPSSMRQVDGSAELTITQAYAAENSPANSSPE